MTDPNIFAPEWDVERGDPPWLSRVMRLGARAGAQRLGVSLYELESGGVVSPYHHHHANEELLVVLSGRPVLRTPEGSRALEPGATVAFLVGATGAHRVSNPGPEPARVMVVSTVGYPEIVEYPDTGAVLAVRGSGQRAAFTRSGEVAWSDAVAEALRAADSEDG